MRVKAMKNWISMKSIWNRVAERRSIREYMTLNISFQLRKNFKGYKGEIRLILKFRVKFVGKNL